MGGLRCLNILYLFLLVGTFEKSLGEKSGRSSSGRRLQKDHHDALKLARCDTKCWHLSKHVKNECVGRCLRRDQKPGECQPLEDLDVWDAACVEACTTDAKCPGMLKCCPHRCGSTCQHPRGLHQASGLPGIPQNVTVWERRRGRIVRIKWTPSPNIQNHPILYIIEERHHVGKHFVESRLGEWMPRQRSQRSIISLKNVIKPGRWYQFRVAAINENGTKGFSKPSLPFTTSHGPRSPGPPQNLTVDALQYQNGTFHGILRWKAPLSSDLPINKYKVYWSRRLQGIDHDLDSVLVNHHSVNKDQTHFELRELQPKSLYFLQVQALTQFGTTRLKSEKSAILLDTKKYSNDTAASSEGNSSKRSAENRIESLQLKKIYWNKGQILARITWRPTYARAGENIRYSVQWWVGPCVGEDKGYKSRKQIAVTTDVSKLELYDLDFNCKYFVQVNKIPHGDKSSHKAVMTFSTPSCEQFQSKVKKEKLKCN